MKKIRMGWILMTALIAVMAVVWTSGSVWASEIGDTGTKSTEITGYIGAAAPEEPDEEEEPEETTEDDDNESWIGGLMKGGSSGSIFSSGTAPGTGEHFQIWFVLLNSLSLLLLIIMKKQEWKRSTAMSCRGMGDSYK